MLVTLDSDMPRHNDLKYSTAIQLSRCAFFVEKCITLHEQRTLGPK